MRPRLPQLSLPRADGRRSAGGERSLEYTLLITATLCLLAIGAVMVYSATSATSLLEGQGYGSTYLIKFLAYGAIGLALMHYLARGGIAKMHAFTAPLLLVSIVLVIAVHIPHVGVEINGAKRWIGPQQLQFQPSELLKLALVLYSATLIARKPRIVRSFDELRWPLLAVVGVGLLAVASQPDIGTSMIICFTVGAILAAAGTPRELLLRIALALVAGGLFYVFVIANGYARARLTSFLNPWASRHSTGFQAVQGQIAIGSGGLFGVGPGASVQKIFYLPEAQTDFIVAVVGEELGVIGVSAVLFLYGVIAVAGIRAAQRARSQYAALVAVGVTVLIVAQALLNVFAVVGLAPLTGVPLPLISYGSSSMIVTLVAMGLLLDVASGATGHVRAVGDPRRRRPNNSQRLNRDAEEDRDRRGRDGRPRRAGARGRA